MALNVKQAYLTVYNFVLGAGWVTVASLVVMNCIQAGDLSRGYAKAAPLAGWLQALSLLETLHAMTGLVRSGVMMNVMQWAARSHALFLAVNPEPSLHAHPAASLMLFSWGLGEACRYPWYADPRSVLSASLLTNMIDRNALGTGNRMRHEALK